MNWEYRVVPFAANAKAGQDRAAAVATQLQMLIDQNQAQGFEYFRLDSASVWELPGCLAGLFGGKPTLYTYDVAVFRRQRS